MPYFPPGTWVVLTAVLLCPAAAVAQPKKIPVIIDTDLGSDIGGALAAGSS